MDGIVLGNLYSLLKKNVSQIIHSQRLFYTTFK